MKSPTTPLELVGSANSRFVDIHPNADFMPFSFGSDGTTDWIEFLGHPLWASEDVTEYTEDGNHEIPLEVTVSKLYSDMMVKLMEAHPGVLLAGYAHTLRGHQLIARERQRQEGSWQPQHDDTHINGELREAAIAYALVVAGGEEARSRWPFENESWKPSEDPIRNLQKAGALIAAEIDRLQRKDLAEERTHPMYELAMEGGFASVKDMNYLISAAPMVTPEQRDAFKDWQLNDGSKKGLLDLIHNPNR